jgi:hypothetical protein
MSLATGKDASIFSGSDAALILVDAAVLAVVVVLVGIVAEVLETGKSTVGFV